MGGRPPAQTPRPTAPHPPSPTTSSHNASEMWYVPISPNPRAATSGSGACRTGLGEVETCIRLAQPGLRLKLAKHPQKNGHRIREPEIFGRDKSPHEKEVQPLHQEADTGFEGDGQPRELTGQLAKEEQEKRFPYPPRKQRRPRASGLHHGAQR